MRIFGFNKLEITREIEHNLSLNSLQKAIDMFVSSQPEKEFLFKSDVYISHVEKIYTNEFIPEYKMVGSIVSDTTIIVTVGPDPATDISRGENYKILSNKIDDFLIKQRIDKLNKI